MAALCPGVQYGLSSQQNFGENKDLIFVKLTDSALRAIEDYLRNQNKLNCQNPTIKFLGNEGQLSFPSLHNGSTSFNFSMSSTADMEGPGGSFECVQQSGPPRGSLEVLGSIPYKIRVHANDDVYEATRHRMTIAEENHKNKCTREIKPNQKDIGRKVKLQQSRSSLPPLRRESPLQRDLIKPSNSNSNNKTTIGAVHSLNNGLLSNGLGSNHVSSSRPQLNKPSVPDVARRPLKERLIHLLALRPFKKVELHERLKDGHREKMGMTPILKQISYMKDNCYYLNRAMWNEVNEDWPFYTESERQILKRRKPQNLTPPGSSDGGSSGSGQSPTSTHPGSPPPPISSSTPSSSSSKRPGYYDNQDGLPTKRQRISHYRKPSEQNYRQAPIENNSQRRPITDSRDASNMNPRSRESPPPPPFITNGYTYNNNNNNNGMLNDINNKRINNNNDDAAAAGSTPPIASGDDRKQQRSSCDSHSLGFGLNRANTTTSTAAAAVAQQQQQSKLLADNMVDTRKDNHLIERTNTNGIVPNGKYNNTTTTATSNNNNNKQINNIKDRSSNNYNNNNKYDKSDNKVSSSNQKRLVRVSPDSQSDRIAAAAAIAAISVKSVGGGDGGGGVVGSGGSGIGVDAGRHPVIGKHDTNSEFPDYLTEYTTIRDSEQRKRYKGDFNADYAEYKDLHGIVEKVSARFAELEDRLKKEDPSSPRYKDIKKQIVKEYQENKKDLEHQKAKRRFQYLHEKLSHIKRLVLEYDQHHHYGYN